MKHLYWLVAAPLMIVAVLFAISNMGPVTLELWPFSGRLTVPVYLVAFGVFAVGFFAGGFVAWIGAGKSRGRARAAERKVRDEEREIADLKRRLEAAENHAPAVPETRALVASSAK